MKVDFRRYLLILMMILISIGVCGCMDRELNVLEYRKEILTHLEIKYDSEFEIIKTYQEFDGNTGVCVRASCKSMEYEDVFTVYCYLDSSMADEKCIIEGKEHGISDNYTKILYQNQILEEIDEINNNNYIIKCKIDFLVVSPTIEEYANGIEYCLQNEDFDPYLKFYIVTQSSTDVSKLRDKIDNVLKKYNPCSGYIYHAFIDEFDYDEAIAVYKENQHDFGNYLSLSDFADRVEFVLYKSNVGFKESKIIKG